MVSIPSLFSNPNFYLGVLRHSAIQKTRIRFLEMLVKKCQNVTILDVQTPSAIYSPQCLRRKAKDTRIPRDRDVREVQVSGSLNQEKIGGILYALKEELIWRSVLSFDIVMMYEHERSGQVLVYQVAQLKPVYVDARLASLVCKADLS